MSQPEIDLKHGFKLSTPDNPEDHSLIFVQELMTHDQFTALRAVTGCNLILRAGDETPGNDLRQHQVIYSGSPRYKYALVLLDLLKKGYISRPEPYIHPTATVHPTAVLGGDGCLIAQCPGKRPLRVPHLGGVEIGADVDVGAHVCIDAGLIDPTIIGNGVKIDNLVHIGHNCHIEEDAILTAGVILGGSTHIGKRVFCGINSTTKQKVVVGDDAVIGMCAAVTHNVPTGTTVAGNPARRLPKL